MSSTASLVTPGAPDAPGEVLAAARDYTAAAAAAERGRFVLAVQWAGMHSADSLDRAAIWALGHGGEDAVLIAGVGAPLVAEFCIPEFAAAVGMSHDAGTAYLGDAIEVRYRLTGLWARVVDGTVPVWRARRVAQQTMSLSKQAAAFVDRHVAPVAHKIGPAQPSSSPTSGVRSRWTSADRWPPASSHPRPGHHRRHRRPRRGAQSWPAPAAGPDPLRPPVRGGAARRDR